jgi:hypothetical protein
MLITYSFYGSVARDASSQHYDTALNQEVGVGYKGKYELQTRRK